MNNFLNFIKDDIEAKKSLIATLPTNNKTNIKKYNLKIDDILSKYNSYKTSVKKYIYAKDNEFAIKPIKKNLDKLSDEVANLEHIRFVLNPQNSYYEKIGFDNLVYQISNYSDFQFDSLNRIINEFLDKFELVGIKLKSNDFDYTCYVNEYMTAFLNVRNKVKSSYEEVSKIFEKIYWVNPEIIEHIELNFRKLIRSNAKKFNKYISKLQKELKESNKIKNYDDSIKKLKDAYIKLNKAEEENIYDIIIKAKNGAIDINHYLPENKIRSDIYSSISIDSLNLEDKNSMDNFYENIEKLKRNVKEYSGYRQFIPLILNFKKKYSNQISNQDKNSNKDLKDSESKIISEEKKLYKINSKIYNKNINKIFKKSSEETELLKKESIKLAKEIYGLYKEYDEKYIRSKVIPLLNPSFTISNLFDIYYSFDYFKKIAIKNVFNISDYEELLKLSEEFDLFAMNPTNVIMSGVALFEESDVSKVIINKYRLSNINLTDEDINSDDIEPLLNKLNILLRINKIEHSQTSVEEIWFTVKSEIIKSEEKD